MKLLVRPPSKNLGEENPDFDDQDRNDDPDSFTTDLELARLQWENYCKFLGNWFDEIIYVKGDDDLSGAVFIEDTVAMFKDFSPTDSKESSFAVITSPGEDRRYPEIDEVKNLIPELGIPMFIINRPGTLDGGDILKVGNIVYVGQSDRTNSEGILQLRKILAPRGYKVIAVPVTKVLHLKSAVTALPDGTIIGYPEDLDNLDLFPHFLPMLEQGAAVLVLSDTELLMSDSCPQSTALIESLGYIVYTVDISELEKLDGCVTCLSVRIR